MKHYGIGLLIGLMMMGGTIYADTAEAILNRVHETTQKVTDFRAIMTQTTKTPFSATPVIESGWIYRKGDKTRREMQKPQRKIIIQSPDGFIEKDLATGKITEQSKPDAIALPSEFRVADLSPEDALHRFNLQVTSESATEWQLSGTYTTIQLIMTVSKSLHTVTRMNLQDSGTGMTVTISNTYTVIGGIPVVTKSNSDIQIKMGTMPATISSVTEYIAVKLNQTLSENLFDTQLLRGAR